MVPVFSADGSAVKRRKPFIVHLNVVRANGETSRLEVGASFNKRIGHVGLVLFPSPMERGVPERIRVFQVRAKLE